MTVYVFAGDSKEVIKKSREMGLKNSVAVFGWGWDSQFDLNSNLVNPYEKNQYHGKVKFLKDIKPNDIIIYTNYNKDKNIDDSHYGECTMMSVTGGYKFNNEIATTCGDFGHTIAIDPNSLYVFNRNYPSIHPLVSKALKPRRAYQKLSCEDKLELSIKNHKAGIVENYFKKEIDEGLEKIIISIQTNHNSKSLEYFLKPLLEQIYSNKYKEVDVIVNGSGWGTDHGADLIIKYKENFDDLDLEISSNKEHTIVVQAKSYKWFINDSNSIEQCKSAMTKYNAEYAILITTAKISDDFNKKIEEHNTSLINSKEENKMGMISVIDGETLAKLYIKYMR